MTVTEHKWFDPVCNEEGCQSLILKALYQSLISALAARSVQTCYSGDAEKFVDAVINNLDEIDAILPDSCNRSLSERIRLLLERANREASLAVELREQRDALKRQLLAERKCADACRLDASRNGERAERAESALAEARNKALDEAAALVCDWCKQGYPLTDKPTNEDALMSIWWHVLKSGFEYPCGASAQLALKDKS